MQSMTDEGISTAGIQRGSKLSRPPSSAPLGGASSPAQREKDARSSVRRIAGLQALGLTSAGAREDLEEVARRYTVALTPDIVDLIDPKNPADPVARQFVPSAAELHVHPSERADPIGDLTHSPVEGIVHRYPDRVLFKLVAVCAVYCRFCFRREMVGPGQASALSNQALGRALAYIEAHREIWEVILSGGDPLMASPRRLAHVMARLGAIAHVKIVRLHTRLPVVAPARITDELVAALRTPGATTYVALHANHPRELTPAAAAAVEKIAAAGLPMLSQTVLLRGVNDDVATLTALMRRFVELRIKPYYLHHGDLAPGTAHFRTTIAEGQALMRALQGNVSGLCQPAYMLDVPGGHGKVPIGPGYARNAGDGMHEITDRQGERHAYADAGAVAPTRC